MRVYNYLHHDLFLMIEVDALLNWIHFKSEVWKEMAQLSFQMHSADYMSSIHRHSHFLSSSMRSFKCIIIIFKKLKEGRTMTGFKICSMTLFSRLFINLLHTILFTLFFAQITIIVSSHILTTASFRLPLIRLSSDILILIFWN
jgi:cellulose synthase/poly-beta-1,6-N-acetylglucosamine synthase-like glycosyltransferase